MANNRKLLTLFARFDPPAECSCVTLTGENAKEEGKKIRGTQSSVIIPAYNAERYLSEALATVSAPCVRARGGHCRG